jgi:hypothetical protein
MNTPSPAAQVQQKAVTPGSISGPNLRSSFEAAVAARNNNIAAIRDMHSSIIYSATYNSVCSNFEILEVRTTGCFLDLTCLPLSFVIIHYSLL